MIDHRLWETMPPSAVRTMTGSGVNRTISSEEMKAPMNLMAEKEMMSALGGDGNDRSGRSRDDIIGGDEEMISFRRMTE